MPVNKETSYTLLNKIEELFTESISSKLLCSPRKLQQHTFSRSTVDRFTVSKDCAGHDYITHPYTREKLYIDHKHGPDLWPKNNIINDIICIFLYCKTIKINDKTLKDILTYFTKCLLIQQKNVSVSGVNDIWLKNKIQDLLLRDFVELLGCTEDIVQILSKQFDPNENPSASLSEINFKEVARIVFANSEILIKNLARDELLKVIFSQDSSISNKNQDKLFHGNLINDLLFMAIKKNNKRLIDLLFILSLTQNIQIDVAKIDQQGRTALYWACFHGQQKVAIKLINLASDVQVRDRCGLTPLEVAYSNGYLELAEILADREIGQCTKIIHRKQELLFSHIEKYEVAVTKMLASKKMFRKKHRYKLNFLL